MPGRVVCAGSGTGKAAGSICEYLFYIQGLQALGQITQILHKEEPEWVKGQDSDGKEGGYGYLFDANTGDFCGGTGAANAFASLNVEPWNSGNEEKSCGQVQKAGKAGYGNFPERLFYWNGF